MRRLPNLTERAATRTGTHPAYDLGRDLADAHSGDWTDSFSQDDLRRTAEEQADEEVQNGNIAQADKKKFVAGYIDGVNTASGEKGGVEERAATAKRPTADPKWMTMALQIRDLDLETWDALGLQSKPRGDEEIAHRVLFLKKMEKAFGPPRKQIPIEVYYELEDANFHSAIAVLENAGYFDATYGARKDEYEREGAGIKPLWDRD